MFGIAKRNAIEELQHKSYKYIYNLCRIYYANRDKQIRYCITNLYSVVGHIPCVNFKYPGYDDIFNALTCIGYNNLVVLIDDFKSVLKYNNPDMFNSWITRDVSIEDFIVSVTRYVSKELAENGRIDFNSLVEYITRNLSKSDEDDF